MPVGVFPMHSTLLMTAGTLPECDLLYLVKRNVQLKRVTDAGQVP